MGGVAKPDDYSNFLAENFYCKKGDNCFEIGFGSGVLLIALAKHFKPASVDGIDISKRAFKLAKRNLELHGVNKKAKLFLGSFPKKMPDRKYGLVFSAPPPIPTPPSETKRDAFYHINEGGVNGRRMIDKIVKNAGKYLINGGRLQFVQADFNGIEKTLTHLRQNNLKPTKIIKRKTRPGLMTTSRIPYIESSGYKFKKDGKGFYFYLVIITAIKGKNTGQGNPLNKI